MVSATAQLSKPRAWTFSIASLVATVLLDHVTGAVISLSFLYIFAAAVAVWCLGERLGLVLSIVAILISAVLKHYDFVAITQQGRGIGLGAEAWNTFARILSIVIVGIVVDGLRIALALERWRASHDGLTGALNKAAFQERAGVLVRRAREQDRALVLAYMDLDGFKGVNDRHGHSAGDRVLRAFAGAAAKQIRDADLFARVGGDEFVALMAVRSCEEGDQVAEMLHGRLTKILRETGFAVTCSMGALVSASEMIDLDDGGLELADTLMYEVKRSGKNALRIARGGSLEARLHAAYPPIVNDDMVDILARIDPPKAEEYPAEQRPAPARQTFFSPAPRPVDEEERQRAVDASGILHTSQDPELQEIVAAGARLFKAPIAALSIVDHNRQWFAARVGLDAPETSRAVSFCAHAILSPGDLLVVPDATRDARFSGNPLVQSDPSIRFYAGVPIIGPNGQPLGALCVIDRKPREEELPLQELSALADRAATKIAAIQAKAAGANLALAS
jgi:diguanylate cyclase (GGDEF)-like protein